MAGFCASRGGSEAKDETLPPPSPVASIPEAETPVGAAREGLAHMAKEDWANAGNGFNVYFRQVRGYGLGLPFMV